MKTAEELNALKNEVEELNKKLAELSEDELSQVTGGVDLGGLGDRIFGRSGVESIGNDQLEGAQRQRKT